jgi:hypothetical protein
MFHETIAPSSRLLTGDIQPGADLLIVQALGRQQNDSGAFCQPDRHTPASAQPLQFLPRRHIQFNGRCFPHIQSDAGKPITLY